VSGVTRQPFPVIALIIGLASAWSADLFAQSSSTAPIPLDGFPLPPGAVHRFGNRQMRHPEGVIAAAVSPNGKWLVTGSYSAVVVWDTKTLSAKTTLPGVRLNTYGSGSRDRNLSFLPDGSLLVGTLPKEMEGPLRRFTEAELEFAQVWDLDAGKKKFAIKNSMDFNVSVWVTAGGKEIALTANGIRGEPSARFFDAKDGKELKAVGLPQMYTSPWVTAGSDLIILQGENGIGLKVLDARTGKEIHSVPDCRVVQAALSADGNLLAYQDDARKIRVYDLDAKKEALAFTNPAEKVGGPMRFSADKKTLYFGSAVGHLYRWNLQTNKIILGLDRHSLWTLTSFALSPDESTLYTMGYNRVIHRWDLKTNKRLPLPEGYETTVVMLPAQDGKHLYVGDHATQLDRWDLATGKKLQQLSPIGSGGMNCLAQSPDGQLLACGRVLQDVQLWDLKTGKVARTLTFGDKPDRSGGDQVQRVAFGPGGKMVVATTPKTGTTAWEVESGKKLWQVPPTGTLVAIDPNGRSIVTAGGSWTRPIKWTDLNPATGETVAQVEVVVEQVEGPPGQRSSYNPSISDLTFTPDGSRLVTAHLDGTVRLWDPDTRREVQRFKVRDGVMSPLGMSADGKWLAVAAGRDVSIWELATGKQVLTLSGHDSSISQVAFTRDGRGLISNADLAPVLWELAPKDLPSLDGPVDALWEGLATEDAGKAYPVQWALARNPKVAVKLFGDRVNPADQAMERATFDKLAADLDSPRFTVREKAEKDLMTAAYRVPVAWLRQAQAAAKSDEQRTRLGRVLTAREKPVADERRLSRAVQALELAGTDEAKALLKTWAGAPEGSLLAVESTAALRRLGP
jgi:WD40 repeat protein